MHGTVLAGLAHINTSIRREQLQRPIIQPSLLCSLQVGVFSATLPPEALEITRKFMNKPVRILVKRDELTLEGIKQVRSSWGRFAWLCLTWTGI